MSKISKDTDVLQSEPSSSGSEEKLSNLVARELADLESIRTLNERKGCYKTLESLLERIQVYIRIAQCHPHVWIITLLCIVIFCGISLPLIFYMAKSQDEEEEELASDLAIETGRWFCK